MTEQKIENAFYGLLYDTTNMQPLCKYSMTAHIFLQRPGR